MVALFGVSSPATADMCKKVDLDGKVIDCPITGTGQSHSIKIKHSFIKGHDDTFALMLVYLGTKRQKCVGDTELWGEKNPVLQCTFEYAGEQGHIEKVRVISVWMNADRERIDLVD